MILESTDVIHDLDVPAFRMKKDAVPGRYNREWFEPNVKGTFDVYCAMYCGQNHSTMRADCVVQDKADYDKWMAEKLDWQKRESFIDRGKELYKTRGCATCHSVEANVKITGPSWVDVYGSTVELEGAAPVLADDAYIEESIYKPGAKIVKGFQNVMPSFEGQLKANDIQAITWYLKSISKNFKGDLAPGQTIGSGKQPATAPATQPAAAPK
jgi:cytochrome c oxidase subunit 2